MIRHRVSRAASQGPSSRSSGRPGAEGERSPLPDPHCTHPLAGLTVAVGPVVVEPVPHLLVDGRHGLHVALAPLPPQVLGLHLEQLQHVQLHHGLLHLQGPLQDGGGFEHHQHLEGHERAQIMPASPAAAHPVCSHGQGDQLSQLSPD